MEDEHTILPLSNFEIVKARTMSRQALQQEVSLQRNQRIFATLLRLRECPQLKSTFNTLQLLAMLQEESGALVAALTTLDDALHLAHERAALHHHRGGGRRRGGGQRTRGGGCAHAA